MQPTISRAHLHGVYPVDLPLADRLEWNQLRLEALTATKQCNALRAVSIKITRRRIQLIEKAIRKAAA